MHIYRSSLLILAFLIAGYSGYANAADESSSPTDSTKASPASKEADKSTDAAKTGSTSQEADKGSNTATTDTANSGKQTKTAKSKEAAASKGSADKDQDNYETKPAKSVCAIKPVMADEDYQLCGTKPPSYTNHLRDP